MKLDVEICVISCIQGTTVLENLYGVHNDPKVWDHPEEFRVERHLNEKQEFVKSKHVIPFGVGKFQIFELLFQFYARFNQIIKHFLRSTILYR